MSVIDEVKQKVDIVEVIGQYASLKKAGRNLTALCPFHSEKNPSFFVYPEQQSWHCFGACNTGGDAFSFVMKKENMDFGEALRLLAQKVGVDIPSRFEPDTRKDEKERLYQVNEAAALYFHNLLLNSQEGKKAGEYLANRGLSQETISDFQLGFSLNSWEALKQYLLEKDYSESEIIEAGLLVEAEDGKTHDRFRNRLLFPINDNRGRTIGFGARVLDDSLPKYVNSPQTALFDKSGIIYGLHLAARAIRQQELAVLVEGYMDVITAHQNGFQNVVAAMGTSITERQVSVLKRLTKNIVLALDADTAGGEATKRGSIVAVSHSEDDLGEDSENKYDGSTLYLNEGDIRKRQIFGHKYIGQNVIDTNVGILVLPSGKDPDDVIKQDISDWQNLVNKAVPLIDYIIDVVTSSLDLTTADGKSTTLENLLPYISQISDSVSYSHYRQKISRLLQLSERDLEATISNFRSDRATRTRRNQSVRAEKLSKVVKPLFSHTAEEECLALMLQHPELRSRDAGLIPEYFENSENREILLAWQQVDDLASLKENLDPSIWEYLDTLINKTILATQIEERYNKYGLRLREDYLRGLARKRASAPETEGMTAGLPLEEDVEVSSGLREVFTQKARKDRQQRR
ncbi:DNA primase [Chloroflexota bacterium]